MVKTLCSQCVRAQVQVPSWETRSCTLQLRPSRAKIKRQKKKKKNILRKERTRSVSEMQVGKYGIKFIGGGISPEKEEGSLCGSSKKYS